LNLGLLGFLALILWPIGALGKNVAGYLSSLSVNVRSLFVPESLGSSIFFRGVRTDISRQLGLLTMERFEALIDLPSVILEHLLLRLGLCCGFISMSEYSSVAIRVNENLGIS